MGASGAGGAAARECRACTKPVGGEGQPLLVCAGCMGVRYCSRDCQQADWRRHKKMCRRLPANSSTVLEDAVG
jgi:hypothetical protein